MAAERGIHGPTPPLTVLYDADCGVCRLTAIALLRLDWRHRLDLVPLQSFAAVPPTEAPTTDELLVALHVRDGEGHWSRGGAASLRIAAAVPILSPLALVGHLPGMAWLAERGYRLVAHHRREISHLFRLDSDAARVVEGKTGSQ